MSLKGVKLVKADGSEVDSSVALEGKTFVLYYFSAHWCPPCRGFTPKLKEFYQKAEKLGVQVVFVSADQSPKDMISYMKESHGDWYAMKHDSTEAKELDERFGISGIPTLVVCKVADDSKVTMEGRADVMNKSPEEAVKAWSK